VEGDNFNLNTKPREAWKFKVKASIFSKEVIEPGQEKNSRVFVNIFFTILTTHKFASPLDALCGGEYRLFQV